MGVRSVMETNRTGMVLNPGRWLVAAVTAIALATLAGGLACGPGYDTSCLTSDEEDYFAEIDDAMSEFGKISSYRITLLTINNERYDIVNNMAERQGWLNKLESEAPDLAIALAAIDAAEPPSAKTVSIHRELSDISYDVSRSYDQAKEGLIVGDPSLLSNAWSTYAWVSVARTDYDEAKEIFCQ